MKKETATAAIMDMPQEFNVDELIEKLIFIENVEVGLKQIDDGEKMPLAEVEKIVKGWRM